ncbi:outer membrane lipoprotein chaperone LolA [Shewanella sp. JM162201]|uniref:Outer-membrane lipoprotein carrier protein n=1 Tax=Shewanella jiangmenensis TaxID=2837387 RepID=A0ABS5V6J5_9GAMM|nr:outer membrane lipoprotein chaperone LolA [Shewanella jiangmenensis]
MKKLLTVLMSFGVMSAAVADDSAALAARLDKMAGLKADFTQKVTDQNGKLVQEGSGQLALAQPNRFYWHLTAPDESLIVAQKSSVWVYNPFAEEVTILGMDDILKASPMALLVHRDADSWSKYDIKAQAGCYNISPRPGTDTAVELVSVCFKGDTLLDIRLTDAQKSVSHFRLSGQKSLTGADDKLFEFTVPEGVSVDDQRAAR